MADFAHFEIYDTGKNIQNLSLEYDPLWALQQGKIFQMKLKLEYRKRPIGKCR